MNKIIKSARFLAEDENGFVIGEADTYEEAQAFGGNVIDTQNGQEEGGLFSSKKNLKEAKKLWDEFENIPINENDEIEEDFLHFEAGTDRFEIWKWFENKFGVSIDKDLMYDITSSRKRKSADERAIDEGADITCSRKLETEVIQKLISGKISEEGAVRIIATAKKCNQGYARHILSHWIEDRAPSLLKSGLADVRGDMNKGFELDGDIDSWSAEYVPQSGKATTKGGEILRAFNVIQCAWFNHGQRLGKGKDKELLNSAARFLKDHSDEKTVKIIDNAFRCKDIESYDNAIESMKLTLSNYLCNNSRLFQSANDEDMLDYYEEEPAENIIEKIELIDEESGTSWKFAHEGENNWVCEKVETDSELSEGDVFAEGSDFEDEVDKTAEFGTFTKDGVEYDYEATGEPDENSEHHNWEITRVVPEDNICDEGQEISGDEIINYMNDGYECHIETDEEPTEEQLRS